MPHGSALAQAMSRAPAFLLLLAFAPGPVLGQGQGQGQGQTPGDGDLDQARAAWRYRREVRLEAGPGDLSLAVLPLPPDLLARCQPEARDLRLLAGDGTELPYLISRKEGEIEIERYPGALSDVRLLPWQRSQWEADLGAERTFDTVELSIPEQDFARRAMLEIAGPDRAFRPLREDLAVFDWRWGRRVHHTTVALGAPARARFLRVTIWEPSAPRVSLRGVEVRRTTVRPGQRWRREVPLRQVPAPRGQSRYQLDLPPGLPLDQVEIGAEDPIFARRAQLTEEPAATPGARPPPPLPLGEGEIYRVLLPAPKDQGAPLRGEDLRFSARRPGGGALFLQIQDGDSPPLRGLQVAVLGVADQLVFPRPPKAQPLRLYYGNPATRAPLYDVELLRGWLERYHGQVAVGAVDAEIENPRHRPAPPLGFVLGAGAALEVSRWRLAQRLPAPERADLYGLTLSPEALAALRPDLGDLRIVDGQGRQVPYVLQQEASEKAVPLHVEPAAARTHRHLLRSDAGSLPFVALELRFDRAFFSRPARLLTPVDQDGQDGRDRPGGAERTLWQGTLALRGEGEEGPLRLLLGDAGRLGPLTLEIDDGDDAPLGLRGAVGVVRLPRIACKLLPDLAAPAGYRVLLGNPEAAPPRYDIETLRQQVLDYAAVPLVAEAIARNPGYRPRAGDYLRAAPPTALLWGALGLAVAGLLLLTARLLRTRSE